MNNLMKYIYTAPKERLRSARPGRHIKVRPNYYDFDNQYIHVKSMFVNEFGQIPNEFFIRDIDAKSFINYVKAEYKELIFEKYERTFYEWSQNETVSDHCILLLSNQVLLHIEQDDVEILYANAARDFSDKLREKLIGLKAPQKEKDFEINIITRESYGLDLKPMEIKPTSLDLHLFYNDDFITVHETILERLKKDNDKGIILLHGIPGTGKTTYLRHLVGCVEKKVLFVSPGVAHSIMNPEFIDLLIDNPNSVLIIEDAENIIMDRRFSNNSTVSNLLNISDGLLSDFLNVQLICTFNSEISLIDQALLRKGRLIAKYEFGKLSVEKSNMLSRYLGFDQVIEDGMTIAEISNQNEVTEKVKQIQAIGFKRSNE